STAIYTPSLHDALPIFSTVGYHSDVAVGQSRRIGRAARQVHRLAEFAIDIGSRIAGERQRRVGKVADFTLDDTQLFFGCCTTGRSEEHTSELQSRENLV